MTAPLDRIARLREEGTNATPAQLKLLEGVISHHSNAGIGCEWCLKNALAVLDELDPPGGDT